MYARNYSTHPIDGWWLGGKVSVVLLCFCLVLGLQYSPATGAESSAANVAKSKDIREGDAVESLGSFTDFASLIERQINIVENEEVTTDASALPLAISSSDVSAVADDMVVSLAPETVPEQTGKTPAERVVTNSVPVQQIKVSEETAQERVAKLLLAAMNEARLAEGLAPYEAASELQVTARRYAESLATFGSLTHDVDGTCGVTCRFSDYELPLLSWGENLGWWQNGSVFSAMTLRDTLMRGWLRSPGHRANILSDDFTAVGVGVVRVDSEWFVVVHFGAF